MAKVAVTQCQTMGESVQCRGSTLCKGGEPAEERGGEGEVAMAPLLLVAMRATSSSLTEVSIGIGS
jgi:hypothetical protein